MALSFKVISSDISVASGYAVDLGVTYSAYVAAGVFVSSAANIAINADGSSQHATIYGSVFGSYGVFLGNHGSTSLANAVHVGATGSVSGIECGIEMLCRNARVVNHGEVHGENRGIDFSGNGTGASVLTNYGTITAGGDAVSHSFSKTESLTLYNYGTISGGQGAHSYNGFGIVADGADKIYNHGLMVGDIDLGAGADLYDGRGGSVDGVILGGEGGDTFVPGSGVDTIDGGLGSDALDFRAGGGIKVALDGSFTNSGTAAGDSYTGIERVYGSQTGADRITGTTGNELLRGFGGADSLSGGAGGDFLYGGSGVDVLTGGAGNDQFCFEIKADAGDLIQDFRNVSGDNDAFRISAAGFGGGLSAGSLSSARFQSRADNHAQDSNDRFIFRTTDKTLWFDANGSASGGLTLVADLQANASVTYHDILLV